MSCFLRTTALRVDHLGGLAAIHFLKLYAALKRRSSTVLRAVRVGGWTRTNIKVEGNRQKCPFHTGFRVASLC
jgi:hypothetical protein